MHEPVPRRIGPAHGRRHPTSRPGRGRSAAAVAGNRQPVGLLHGGANAVLVEHAASVLALLHAPQGKTAVGTELNVSQLRAATTGHVTARATIISRARSSVCSSVEIHDDDGVLTAVGRMTNVFIAVP